MPKKSRTKTKAQSYEATAMRVSKVSLVGNAALSVFKLIAGLFGHSSAMVSDAIHSASDVLSTIVVMIGIKVSAKSADDSHPYGHERLECVAAIILSIMLAAVGFGIGYSAVTSLVERQDLATPTLLALIASIISILAKEAMYRYAHHHAKRINSTALMADAWHHRSDALSSIGALIGIAGARLGFPFLDPAASIVICGFILKAAWDIFIDAVNKMVDHACSAEVQKQFLHLIESVPGVERVDDLRTREFGARIYVDVEIAVDGQLTLAAAHQIAETVHDKLEQKFPEIKHCMVHENPA